MTDRRIRSAHPERYLGIHLREMWTGLPEILIASGCLHINTMNSRGSEAGLRRRGFLPLPPGGYTLVIHTYTIAESRSHSIVLFRLSLCIH